MKIRKLGILLLSLFLIFAISLAYELQVPDCVQAQSCTTIRPTATYGVVGGSSGGGCASPNPNPTYVSAGGGIGLDVWLASAGFEVRYSTSNDHHLDEMRVFMSAPGSNQSQVYFTSQGCLNDGNDDDNMAFSSHYVIARWQ